ncbi:unnamed protein product [Urochloa humidicola]
MPRPEVQAASHMNKIINALGIAVALYIACGIALATRGGNSATACIPFLQWTLICMGLVLGFAIAYLRACGSVTVHHAFFNYIGTMSIVLPILLCLMIVVFIAIPIKPVGKPGRGKVNINGTSAYPVRDYSLGDYGGWLRRRMGNQRYWASVSKCLRHRRHACDGMSPLVHDPNNTGVLLAERHPGLSPIESGCCKPPLSCGFTYDVKNQTTTWTPPGVPTNTTDDDCSQWSSDQEKLCFQCDSCKAGVLAQVQSAWSPFVISLFTLLLLQIVTLCVACFGATK